MCKLELRISSRSITALGISSSLLKKRVFTYDDDLVCRWYDDPNLMGECKEFGRRKLALRPGDRVEL